MNNKVVRLPFKKSVVALSILLTTSSGVFAEEKTINEDTEVITVQGRAAQFYFVEESAMATKTPTDFMDLPQSVQVLSQALIQDQAAKQTTDLYRSISGVTQFSYSGITARGFRQDQVRYDGVQGDPYSGFSIPQLFNVEQVEVLKGPTGMLYGGGQPGGLLNYVTKKPKFQQSTKLSLIAGNNELFGGSVDTTDALNDDKTLAYRVGAFYQSDKGFRNNTDEQNILLSSGLTWLVNDKVDLTFQYDYIDQDLGGHRLRGVPVDDEGNFLTDISYNPNEKTDFQRVNGHVFQVSSNTDITEKLFNTTVLRVLDNEKTQNYHENRGLAADGRTMTREFRDQHTDTSEWSLTTDFVYQSNAFGLDHTLLYGADYFTSEIHYESKVGRGAPSLIPDIDIINPVYGSDPSDYLLLTNPDVDSESNKLGIYVQDQVRINKNWLAIAGVRYDKFEDKNITGDYETSDESLSPRIGAIYQPSYDTSVFFNITKGFSPQDIEYLELSDSDNDSLNSLKPETSIQHEIGIKNQWLNNSFNTTITAYHIVKENVTSGNPDDTGANDGIPSLVQIGEVTSEGIEIDIVGDFTETWTGTVSYAFNKAKITGGSPDSLTNSVGDEFVNAPDHTLGAWTRWDLPAINSAFAFGADYVSERVSLSGQKVKPYTVWDASWHSTFDNVKLQLNLKNLFDKEYATSGFNERNGHFPGEPRSVELQVSYSL